MFNDFVFETRCLSSLVKVFADEQLIENAYTSGSALLGEYYSFQVAYRSNMLQKNISVSINSELKDIITVKSVGLVPSNLPNYHDHDDNLLRTTPGLYPDPLYDEKFLTAKPNQWQAIWVTVKTSDKTPVGKHNITINFIDGSNNVIGSEAFTLKVIGVSLPEQKLIHTEWFYFDTIATWYNVEVFSDKHWKLIESYLENYLDFGINMVLTPIFTPPLETEVGNERPTVQLVGVEKNEEGYKFDFTLLEKWINICLKKGVKYFEFAHLYTQWGAKHAPKIIANVNGNLQRIFGWETDANGDEYKNFLSQFIPQLMNVIEKYGLQSKSYFHISDEPYILDIEHYKNASVHLRSLIGSYPIIDALSDFNFYATGLLSHPVVSTEHIVPFINSNVENLWAYYCCCEYKKLSNRFFNMPSARTRIIGTQLYKFNIQGFLHWGYNHWYSQKSVRPINPFIVTDAICSFPSGDAFLVYPGEAGPINSLRIYTLREAMQDIRAFSLLESKIGKDETIKLVEEQSSTPITFIEYEKGSKWLLEMRERINNKLEELYGGNLC